MAIKLRTVFFILLLVAVAFFAAINWPLFSMISPINVLIGTVAAPLGIIMLTILAGVTLLYLLFVAKMETESLVGSRKYSRELEEARKLALSAEESRLATLREEMREGLGSLEEKVGEILRRVDAQGRIAVRRESTAIPEPVVRANEDLI